MKLSWILVWSFALCACSPERDLSPRIAKPGGNNNNKPGSVEKPHSGVITNLNGTWVGKGTVKYNLQEFDNLDFTLRVSEIPTRLTTQLEVSSSGNSFFAMQLGAFNIEGNSLQEYPSKKNVGSIGTTGFSIQSSKTVYMNLVVQTDKSSEVSGYYTDTRGRLEFKGTVGNSQF